VRKEMAGAWRSVEYDLDRWRSRRDDGEETTELIFPEEKGPPRRLLATGGFALFAAVSAVGTYFAVVNGLGALLETEAAAGEAPAPVVAGADGVGARPADPAGRTAPPRAGRSGGPLTVAGRQAASGDGSGRGTGDGVPVDEGGQPRPGRPPIPEESRTPAPPTTSPTPTPTGSAGPTEPPSDAPTPTPTGTAGPTPGPSGSGEGDGGTGDTGGDGDGDGHDRWRPRHGDQDEHP